MKTNNVQGVMDYPDKIAEVLRNRGNPEFVWRETILEDLHPLDKYMRRHEGNGWRKVRKAITMCLSDPKMLGYTYDGGSNHNPRFKKVKR